MSAEKTVEAEVEKLTDSIQNINLGQQNGVQKEQTEKQIDDGLENIQLHAYGEYQLTQETALKLLAHKIKSQQIENVICMVGAGISVSAGIPDFRSKGTGLFDNLKQYDLPSPESVFEIDFFRDNPLPFYKLMKQLLPEKFSPTPTHFFMKLLHEKGILKRVWSQNIDSLERKAGIPEEKIIAAHGNFDEAKCIKCKSEFPIEELISEVKSENYPVHCKNKKCDGLIKPGIVFYGENLPDRFFQCIQDFENCDLLIVIGTSLKVAPFSTLVDIVGRKVPRLLINRERVGPFEISEEQYQDDLLKFLEKKQVTGCRDMTWLGNCDEGVKEFSNFLGWQQELNKLCSQNQAK